MSGIRELTPHEARLLRIRSQRLLPELGANSVADAVRASAGLQAQSWPAAVLGVRPRSHGLTAEDVERARVEERSVVRSWFMRGTLHLVPAEDVDWLLRLLGPVFVAADTRRRRQLHLDDATYSAATNVLEHQLADGPKTRAEIGDALVRAGVPVDPKSQALIHLIQGAALEGRVCYGPAVGSEQQIVLLRDWIPAGPTFEPEAAAIELARRYLRAFAPASPADFGKWSGLSMPECRRAFAHLGDELVEVRLAGKAAWLLRTHQDAPERPSDSPLVRLLPAFDNYSIGYIERRLLVDAPFESRIQNGGIVNPALTVDGLIAGTWKFERKARELVVRVAPFEPLGHAQSAALEAEVADIGRFYDSTPRLVLEGT